MNANKQFINLLGIVVIAAILVAGVALIALPMWSQSRTTDASTRTVAQTNAVYEVQVSQLTAAQDGEADLDRQLAELRADIPAITKYDDVFDIVNGAATDLDLTIQTITIADAEDWTPRAAAVEAPAEAPAAGAQGAGGDEEADSAATTDPAAVPTPTEPTVTPQRQATVTIEVAVPDAKTATAFIDALGKGPRLLSPLNAALDDGTLTLTVLTFFRTED
ncbi:hypothetical protein FVP74_13805 [Microbacterium saccharophilum]|uniref:Uncharacterized protein n=1 Tax=Microbacterium saccharophilum TaxID=1213358 RepID=A0A5C8HUY5_9MICO|nr:hypothetical protein [Microbacterium saccharophilum]TXK08761.1 hypothetical protein FVP74_13805 [Microbacterium saccharophilum]GEP49315.1 hypothetical protein MSA03_28230 [Microbacterium saccharophilum]